MACIADIQRMSLHDGPGLRTTVFFKGCPLHCAWCHNPECIDFEQQILHYPEKCISCGKCEQGCYSGAKVICGQEMTKQEVLAQIMLDIDYYTPEGGVTFSGGEPLAQADFLSEMIKLCHQNKIHTAIETSLYLYREAVFKEADLVMADMKIWDDNIHKKYTGVSNARIKEHFLKLNALNIPIIARTPIIPSVNQGIAEISSFLKELKNVKQYELLPYHPLGESKRQALGMEQHTFEIPTEDMMKELNKYAYIR